MTQCCSLPSYFFLSVCNPLSCTLHKHAYRQTFFLSLCHPGCLLTYHLLVRDPQHVSHQLFFPLQWSKVRAPWDGFGSGGRALIPQPFGWWFNQFQCMPDPQLLQSASRSVLGYWPPNFPRCVSLDALLFVENKRYVNEWIWQHCKGALSGQKTKKVQYKCNPFTLALPSPWVAWYDCLVNNDHHLPSQSFNTCFVIHSKAYF